MNMHILDMAPKPSVSFIIAAYNVEKTLKNTISLLLGKLEEWHMEDYEILIAIDAKTTDQTPQIAQKLAGSIPKIMVVSRTENISLGLILINSLGLVKKEYYCLYTGKDSCRPESFDHIFPLLGQADIIACYVDNAKDRPWLRRFASWTNVSLVNMLFGLDIPYYHLYFCRASLAKQVPLSSPSYSSMDEVLIWLLKSGATFVLAPFYLKPQTKQSSALKFKNIAGMLSAYAKLFWKIIILGQKINLNRQ